MQLNSSIVGLAWMALGALIGAAAPPAAAQQKADAGASAPAPVPDKPLQLARLLNPADRLVDVAMRGFQVGVDTALKQNPKDAAIFNDNPGLIEAIVEAGKPIVRSHIEAAVPAYQGKFAEFYARTFSPAEVEQLIAFYSTPTGTKVITGMYDGADLASFAAEAGKADKPLTADAIRDYTSSAGAKLLPGFDADDWKALFTFAATPAYAKLRSSTPELRQLTADMANEPDKAMDAELDKAVEATVAKYMAAKKADTKR